MDQHFVVHGHKQKSQLRHLQQSDLTWAACHSMVKLVKQSCLKRISIFQDDCQNYIRVLVKLDEGEKLLVCGTNAYSPMCRHYLIDNQSGVNRVQKEFSGRGFCPYDPKHNSTTIYAGKKRLKSKEMQLCRFVLSFVRRYFFVKIVVGIVALAEHCFVYKNAT